jgi:Ca2+-binding EF-hand superfamily protein
LSVPPLDNNDTKPGRHWPGFFVCALLASLPAFAAAQVRGSSDYLERMDRDGDGRVSLVEYQDWLSYAFEAMDRDHDGVLSRAELPGGRGQPVTRAEQRTRLAAAFQRQDRNGDGVLDVRELAAPPR